jgi:hypothetical protein
VATAMSMGPGFVVRYALEVWGSLTLAARR